MSTVKFGIAVGAYSAGVPSGRELADFARTAEAVGFDSVQVGDHIQWHAPIIESTVLLATFAAVTTRVRIASDVVILPLRDPVLIAKTVASLDVLSGGRMIFGVGVGGDHPGEYAAMRVPLAERGARANESLEIIRGLWTNERFSYAGRHYAVQDVGIAPRPLQPLLPIWVGGTSDAALRRAARYGDGWICAFASERKFARLVEALRGFLAEAKRPADGFTLGTSCSPTLGRIPPRPWRRAPSTCAGSISWTGLPSWSASGPQVPSSIASSGFVPRWPRGRSTSCCRPCVATAPGPINSSLSARSSHASDGAERVRRDGRCRAPRPGATRAHESSG